MDRVQRSVQNVKIHLSQCVMASCYLIHTYKRSGLTVSLRQATRQQVRTYMVAMSSPTDCVMLRFLLRLLSVNCPGELTKTSINLCAYSSSLHTHSKQRTKCKVVECTMIWVEQFSALHNYYILVNMSLNQYTLQILNSSSENGI